MYYMFVPLIIHYSSLGLAGLNSPEVLHANMVIFHDSVNSGTAETVGILKYSIIKLILVFI